MQDGENGDNEEKVANEKEGSADSVSSSSSKSEYDSSEDTSGTPGDGSRSCKRAFTDCNEALCMP